MVASPIALTWEHYTNMENLFWNSSLVSVRLVAIPEIIVPGITDLRRPPDVVGRVGRPAHAGKRLAAVVVRGSVTRKTMRVPPVHQAAAVRVPATDRVQPLQEALRG